MDRQKIERSIKGLSEWQMHVQAESDIDTNISTAIEALKAQLSQEGTTSDQHVATDTNVGDTISRKAAIDALDFEIVHMTAYCDGKNEGNPLAQYNKGLEDGKKAIEALPSAQPERKTGTWIYDENGMDWNLGAWVCSECHCRNDNIPTVIKFGNEYKRIADPRSWQGSRFCPNCGADMRGEQDG